jgi:hypothetical protein
MVRMELSDEEARLLLRELRQREYEREVELVHTDERAMQHAVREDYERLQALVGKIGRMIGGGDLPRS